MQLLKVAEKEFEDELSDEIVKLDDEDKELNDKISNVKKSLENSDDS